MRSMAHLVSSSAMAALVAGAGVSPAAAQVSPPPAATPAPATAPGAEAAPGGEAARVYTPADFTRFAPRTALDMLRQVPGFTIREGVVERGLGQASANVLLNGQRISGKSDDVVTQLNRIPSQNVERIEIVDGATLSIPGLSGQVANVIARAGGGLSGQWAWQPEFRAHYANPRITRFQVSATGRQGPVEYTVGLENLANRSGAGGPTQIFDRNNVLTENRDDAFAGDNDTPRVFTRFALDGPGSSVGNLNLSYRRTYYNYKELGFRSGPNFAPRSRTVTQEQRGYNYEIGGDFELALGPGRLKLIGLNRFSNNPSATNLIVGFYDGSPNTGSRFARVSDESELIGRAEYRFRALGGDWQFSGEAAFNSLDSVSRLFLLDTGGRLNEIPLPGGTARISEDRFEAMASHSRPLAENLDLQLSLGGEYSQLTVEGPGGETRTFLRPKGLLSLAWEPSENLDVNLRIQRRVGQLNFLDFLASVNLADDRENAGNPDLVPPQSWEVDLEGVLSLGAWGSTTLRAYGRLIDDIVDIVPIGATGQSPGNLDSAYVVGLESRSTINLDPLGWRGARLDLRGLVQHSRVDDPLTGIPRSISNYTLHFVEAALRYDVPETPWAFGGTGYYQLGALQYRLDEVGRQWEGPVWLSAFAEHKDVFGLTVRATVSNILNARSLWNRTVYVGRRTGPIDYIERRDRLIGPIFSFSVTGRF